MPVENKAGHNQLGPLITLFLALAAGPATALYTEHGAGVRPMILLLYVTWLGVVVALVLCINRASLQGSDGRNIYAYDKATQMAGRVVFSASAAVFLVFAFLGFTNRLPGQPKLLARVTDGAVLKAEEMPDPDVAGLELFVPLVKQHFSSAFPDKGFTMVVTFDKQTLSFLKLIQSQIYPVSESGSIDADLRQRGRVTDNGDGSYNVIFETLPVSSRYRVRLILAAQNPNNVQSHPDDYKAQLIKTLKQILTQGGANISLRF